ncbi:hypothetical protein Y032_0008g365 [Ancylostoma ceylanicum]|uniref:Uncharacterized protein n=1 Tax=Ancylostoma ceylanicum TaxID=53326 RepID=A0A016VL72_9BILA|nr:hypothetical protein Y032_0008g365 [Ancylostoma ceylanicum]
MPRENVQETATNLGFFSSAGADVQNNAEKKEKMMTKKKKKKKKKKKNNKNYHSNACKMFIRGKNKATKAQQRQ